MVAGSVVITTAGAELRWGVFGGTFDPPHNGHLSAMAHVRDALGLDRLIVVVAGDPWQKTSTGLVTAASHRLAMVRAMVNDVRGVEASDIEVVRGGPSRTVETLSVLAAPGVRLLLVVGADVAGGLETWHHHEKLPELADLVIVARGDDDPASLGSGPPRPFEVADVVAMPRLDISSTMVRLRLGAGLGVEGLVPPAVASYVERHRLYRGVS